MLLSLLKEKLKSYKELKKKAVLQQHPGPRWESTAELKQSSHHSQGVKLIQPVNYLVEFVHERFNGVTFERIPLQAIVVQ